MGMTGPSQLPAHASSVHACEKPPRLAQPKQMLCGGTCCGVYERGLRLLAALATQRGPRHPPGQVSYQLDLGGIVVIAFLCDEFLAHPREGLAEPASSAPICTTRACPVPHPLATMRPHRFVPHSDSRPRALTALNPMPQILSRGLASTHVLIAGPGPLVALSTAHASAFCENLR